MLNTYFRSKIALALLFTAMAGAVGQAKAQQVDTTIPGLSLMWSRNVGGLKSMSLSPHARRLALLTYEGKLALWTAQEGVPVWATGNQNSTDVLVSDGAGTVLTYNYRALLNGKATMRRADTGAVIWSKTYDSSVWTAVFNKDGTYAAIGTGDNAFYLYNLTDGVDETKVPLAGTPVSAAFASDGNSVLVGQWDRSGISCLDMAGKTMWRASGAMNRLYSLMNVGSRYITYVGSSNRHGLDPILYVVRESTGALLWAYALDDDTYGAVALTDENGDMTAASYARSSEIQSGTVIERRLAAIDRFGQMKWKKGGLFWSPTLICLTPDQSGMVVYDGNRTLYRLDSQGRTVAHASLSDTLRKWSVSDDDTSLVVYTHDGQLSLLHIQ